MRRLLLFAFSHRFLAIARWDFYFIRLRIWNTASLQRARIRHFLRSCQRPVFLNLGAGPRGIVGDHWLNVDGFKYPNVHFLIDLSRPLPFPDSAFDGVFCEHVLEHFSLGQGEILLREVRRVLCSGGCLRIVVPDAELALRRYLDMPAELVAKRCTAGETAMEVINSLFRQRYEHQFMYDWPTMEKVLQKAGFTRIRHVRFSEPANNATVLDDPRYERESLYVEALR